LFPVCDIDLVSHIKLDVQVHEYDFSINTQALTFTLLTLGVLFGIWSLQSGGFDLIIVA
jgi:hypothetical protein